MCITRRIINITATNLMFLFAWCYLPCNRGQNSIPGFRNVGAAAQAETIAQQAQIIEQQAATITRLEAENRDLRDQLEVMHFRVSQMSRRIFGNVSERIVDDADQAYFARVWSSTYC